MALILAIGTCLFFIGVALASGNRLVHYTSYFMFAVVIISYVSTRFGLRGLQLSRSTRVRRLRVGETLRETLTVTNRSVFPKLWVELRDHSDLPGYRLGRVISIGSRQQVTLAGEMMCLVRGKYHLGPITLATGDPFGIFRRRKLRGRPQDVLVYPSPVDLGSFNLPAGNLTGGAVLPRRTEQVTPNAAGVRDYRPGDSFNRIHWNSSARTGMLMVKEFELDPTSQAWLLLDLQTEPHVGRLSGPQLLAWAAEVVRRQRKGYFLPPSTEEYAIATTASLAHHFVRQHRSVGLIAYGQRREVLLPDRGERQLNRILEALAVLHAAGATSISEALAANEVRFVRNSNIVVVTPSTGESWVADLRYLMRRGVRPSVVLIEPSTFGGSESSLLTMSTLAAAGIPAYLVKNGEPIEQAFRSGLAAPVSR